MWLQNKQIKLRALEPEDIDLLYLWENTSVNWSVSNTVAPFSRHLLTEYIANSDTDIFTSKQLRLMIDLVDTKETIGAIDLFDFDPFHARAGVGLLVANQKHRKQGYAKLSLKLMEEYAFGFLNMELLFCDIAEDNAPSIALFEQMAYKQAGYKQNWQKTPNGRVGVFLYIKSKP